ncbi:MULTISPECIES: DUF2254 domain-containing protein [Cyanophyceae]|uniref:DUF2254 domain-containing protein n=1 Tax=Cyanophyceae TaxID=3028117 RepID=UPI0016869380|nr:MULTISPECIES: DUF2254 domain-containing protein [Cyanophyceae]MBD1916608.1 DUF2254 domain-containing protein [Phormidium sp. FACHB-77]MBD2032175.1 DUF2254 domain-containing protein [Phormidium sp. FACHB-322]MBD2053055.1 DUF2254 domain-containing protein [Leptolyngbya sp. FACHB-60]
MKHIKLSKFWDNLRSSYWFLPTLMAVGAIALAFGLLSIDRSSSIDISALSWIYQGGADGARAVLSVIAGSMVTVAATAFSITIVALQLASSHFGPRLLRNFMQDQGNQLVLGTFIATFIYCLLVLRTIRGEDYQLFVPQLSVTVGVLLAMASIGVLIYFIHHASTIIQVSHVIADVSHDLEQVTNRLFPEALGHELDQPDAGSKDMPTDFETTAGPVWAKKTGYLQGIEDDTLMQVACDQNLLLQVNAYPGAFIIEGSPLVMAYPASRITPSVGDRINQAFVMGRDLTKQQNVAFPIEQLVEIALRALSPAINDPFTAIRCIDRLAAGLARLAERELPSPYRYDQSHTLRVIAAPVKFETLADIAFSQIRQYGSSDTVVIGRLLAAIAAIAPFTRHFEQRYILQQHLEAIWHSSQQNLNHQQDLETIEKQYHTALAALHQPQSAAKTIL